MASSRQQAISLYRRLLRAAQRWQGPSEEAAYIRQEARQQFRASQNLTSAEDVAKALEECEKRLEVGLHYGIAYPRLFHADQFEKVPYVHRPMESAVEEMAGSIKDKGTAARLAAAAARRKERLAQQQHQQHQKQGQQLGQQPQGPGEG